MNSASPLASTSFSTIIFQDNKQKSGVFILGASTVIPIKMRFDVGQHPSSEKHAVSK